jgi:hypothetical protein
MGRALPEDHRWGSSPALYAPLAVTAPEFVAVAVWLIVMVADILPAMIPVATFILVLLASVIVQTHA